MELINLSGQPDNLLYSWLPHDLKADNVVFFPDACPGNSLLPTGTVVLTRQEDWRKFAVSDVGCGMLMGIAKSKREDFTKRDWDSIGKALKSTKGGLGDIGSGNHFLDALESYSDNNLYFVCHTGSRFEGKELQNLIDSPKQFDEQYRNTRNWARENRLTVMKILEKYFGRIDIILDKDHNHYEVKDETIIIRKGAVQLSEGELTIIPSSMTGDMVLVKGSPKINEINNSLSHGTGRCFSRSQGKAYAEEFDFGGLRRMIYIPDFISDASIKTEAPFCYRDLDDCLSFISEYIEVQERYSPFAYLGQL